MHPVKKISLAQLQRQAVETSTIQGLLQRAIARNRADLILDLDALAFLPKAEVRPALQALVDKYRPKPTEKK